jgi:hypothetical protein
MGNVRQGSVRNWFRIERCPRLSNSLSQALPIYEAFRCCLSILYARGCSIGRATEKDQALQVFAPEGNRGTRRGTARMRSVLHQTIALLTVILAVPLANGARGCAAAHGLESASPAVVDALPSRAPTPAIGLSLGFAMADFTGDTHPDLATVELNRFDSASAQYVIEIRLSEGGRQLLRLRAPFGGLLITPKDVTGDGTLDLVVRAAKSRVPVAVFINDGGGHFSAVAEPAAFARALREAPSELGFTTEQFRFGATVVSSESYTAECQSGSARNPQEQNGSLFFENHGAPSHSFLPFGLNRAPPTVA